MKKELLTKCTENPNQNGNEYKISNTKMVNIIKDCSDTLRDKPNKTIKMFLLFDGKFEKNYVEMHTMRPTIRYETKQNKTTNIAVDEIVESFSEKKKYILDK